jgi:hypothetical protein
MARLRFAERLLAALGMTFAKDKTSQRAIPVTEDFEFLGIELNNGLIRPSRRGRLS